MIPALLCGAGRRPDTANVTYPVESLQDFFPTYLALLEAGDAAGLGMLYTKDAVLTSSGGPGGTTWAVGRDEIVATLAAALAQFTVDTETPPDRPYDLRGASLAARLGTFTSTFTPKAGGPATEMTVEAFEVLALSPVEGWQYLADQSRAVSVTTSPPSR